MRLLSLAVIALLTTPFALGQSTPPTALSPQTGASTTSAQSTTDTGSTSASLPASSSINSQSSSAPVSSSTAASSTVASSTASSSSAQPTATGGLSACLGATFGGSTDFFPDKVVADKTAGFDVQYNMFYKLVNNLHTSETWIVYCSSLKPNTSFATKGAIQVPLSGNIAAVDMSIIGYLDLLGLSNLIKYVGNADNITSPCSSSASTFSTSVTDAAVVFQADLAPNFPNYVTTSSINDDLTPLQKFEWIKYFAALTNTEAVANQVYQHVVDAYQCYQKNIASSTIFAKRNITFTSYDASAQAWTFPNTTYAQTLTSHAGAQLLVPPQPKLFDATALHGGLQNTSLLIDSSPSSSQLSFQVWLSSTGYDTGKIASADQAAQTAAQTNNQPYVNPFDAPPFLRYGRLYRPDFTANSKYVWDYTTRASARPDLVLLDLILAQFPSYAPSAKRTFLRNLGQNSTESPSAANYPCPPTVATCSSNTIVDMSSDNPLVHSNAPTTLSTTTKVILGVVCGLVGLAVLSVALVTLRRKIKDRGLRTGEKGAFRTLGREEEVEMVPEGRF